jgi:hypothetical protein
MLFASVCNINTPGQLKSHQIRQANHFSLPCQVEKCDFGAVPSSHLFATLAVKGLKLFLCCFFFRRKTSTFGFGENQYWVQIENILHNVACIFCFS